MFIDGIPSYLVKNATAPGFEAGEIILDHINVYRKIKGKVRWNDMTLGLYDPVTPSGAQAIMEWARLAHESVTGRDGYSDFYIKDLEGYRKKVTPQSNGRFMVTLHQANLNITKENGEFTLRYLNKNKAYFEKIKKIDSQQLIILDKEGYIYKYNRYTPIEINQNGK